MSAQRAIIHQTKRQAEVFPVNSRWKWAALDNVTQWVMGVVWVREGSFGEGIGASK